MTRTPIANVTAENFGKEVLEAGRPTLVDFWAPWCGPCHAIAPLVDATAQAFAEQLKVARVNVDDAPDLAARYDVMSIPTLTLFSGGKAVKTWVGTQAQEGFVRELIQELSRLLDKPIVPKFTQPLAEPQETAHS